MGSKLELCRLNPSTCPEVSITVDDAISSDNHTISQSSSFSDIETELAHPLVPEKNNLILPQKDINESCNNRRAGSFRTRVYKRSFSEVPSTSTGNTSPLPSPSRSAEDSNLVPSETETETSRSALLSFTSQSRRRLRKSKSDGTSKTRNLLSSKGRERQSKFMRQKNVDENVYNSDNSICMLPRQDSKEVTSWKQKGRNLSITSLNVPSFSSLFESVRRNSPKPRSKNKKNNKDDIVNQHRLFENFPPIPTHNNDHFQAILKVFQKSARIELKHLYSRFKIPFPFSWLTNQDSVKIEEIFVEPDMTFNRHLIEINDLFTVQPNRVDKNPVIIIKGESGCGKTALCHYLTQCWCNDPRTITNLDSFHLVFMLSCKYIGNYSLILSVRDFYLKDSIDSLPSKTDEFIFSLIFYSQTLFLLDGFDESSESCKEKIQVIRSLFPNSKIVVTTRTSGMRDVIQTLNLNPTYDVIEFLLNNFNDKRKVNLIVNLSEILGKSDDDQFELLDHIEERFRDNTDILDTPLHIILYIIIWVHKEENVKGITTVNDLFHHTIELMKHQLFRLLGMKKYADRSIGEGQVSSLMLEMGKISLSCIQNRQFYFTPLEYDIIKRHSSAVKINHYIAFPILMEHVDYLQSRNLRVFFHTSIMEYLAACYVDHMMKSVNCNLFSLISSRNLGRQDCACGCLPHFNINAGHGQSNILRENHQLDSLLLFFVQVSLSSGNGTSKMGEEIAEYFPMNYNRNLATLASIVKVPISGNDRFLKGIKKSLAKQRLPMLVHSWNIKHVITLINSGTLTPDVFIKFSVERKYDWGETVNNLVKAGCRPYVKVVLEQAEQMQAFLRALQIIEQPKIPKFILHFGYMQLGLTELVQLWPYPNPIHIMSTGGKYSMEAFLVCVALVNLIGKKRVKHVTFYGDEASYIFGMLKKSLPHIRVHLSPTMRENDYVVIATRQ